MTDLPLLVSTLEQAGEGSRELDARLCRMFFLPACQEPDCLPDVMERCIARVEAGGEDSDVPRYTASVDLALALIGEQLPGWTYTLTYWPPDAEAGFTRVTLGGPGYISDEWEHDTIEVRREGNVPALALCLALCRALQAQGETHDA